MAGCLRQLFVDPRRVAALTEEAAALPFVTLNERQQCDLELLMTGAYSPLTGFMTQDAYRRVLETLRLPSGLAFPLPVTLDIDASLASALNGEGRGKGRSTKADALALRDREGVNLAILRVEELWRPDPDYEAAALHGSPSLHHRPAAFYVGGRIEGLELPARYGFESRYQTPAQVRELAPRIAVHAHAPLHRFERDYCVALSTERSAPLLLHPVDAGVDFDSLERMAHLRAYHALLAHFPPDRAVLCFLPYVARGSVDRETALQAIIRQNYGCSVVVLFPASPAPLEAAVQSLIEELEIEVIRPEPHVYRESSRRFVPASARETDGSERTPPREAELAAMLEAGASLPRWFSFPEVMAALEVIHPPRSRQGLVVFFTGLSGSGKSTLARYVFGRLLEAGARPVTLLDGDVVRQQLSSELGFSKAHRDLNIRRIGYVAAEIAKNRGVAMCAPIAPYAATRAAVRAMVERNGAFIEVHVATPIEVCEARDRKGLYALARQGKIQGFTGINDPYEAPERPALKIDTSTLSAEAAGELVLDRLRRDGYIE